MRHPRARWLLPFAIIASTALGAQSAPQTALGKLAPLSDIRADWLTEGVPSPNGRFYLLTSYASNDSGLLRYDRAKRSWAYLGKGIMGAVPRWSPNGRFVSYLRQADDSRQRFVWVAPMDTATGLASGPSRRVSTRAGFGPVAWSPDGRRIAFIARDSARASIVAVPFNGGDEEVLFTAAGTLGFPIWSPDGRFMYVQSAAAGRTPQVLRVSLDERKSNELGEVKAPLLDISPDGKWLAQYQSNGPVLHLLSTDGKATRTIDVQGTVANLTPVGWSRTNPNEMVALDHIVPTGIQRVSVADGRIRTIVSFDSGGLSGADLSPDERQLGYIRLKGGVRQLVVSDTNGANPRVLVAGARSGARWSPTGQHIAYRSTNEIDLSIVEVSSGKQRELLTPAPTNCGGRGPTCDGRLGSVAWRTDGRAIRYLERRATAEGHAVDLLEVDLEGRQRIVGSTTLAGNPFFIPRNDTLILVSQPNALHLVNVHTGTTRLLYSGATRGVGLADASGQWVVVVAETGGNGAPYANQPYLVSLVTGEAKKYPYSLGGEVSHGDFLPDGRNVLLTACVSCREPAYVEKWDIILSPINGDPPRILTGSEASFKDFWPITITKDGRTVYFTAEQSYNTRLVTIALPKD